jgi:hypothetical protein
MARHDVARAETPMRGIKRAHPTLCVLDLAQRQEFWAAMYPLTTPNAPTQLRDMYT